MMMCSFTSAGAYSITAQSVLVLGDLVRLQKQLVHPSPLFLPLNLYVGSSQISIVNRPPLTSFPAPLMPEIGISLLSVASCKAHQHYSLAALTTAWTFPVPVTRFFDSLSRCALETSIITLAKTVTSLKGYAPGMNEEASESRLSIASYVETSINTCIAPTDQTCTSQAEIICCPYRLV